MSNRYIAVAMAFSLVLASVLAAKGTARRMAHAARGVGTSCDQRGRNLLLTKQAQRPLAESGPVGRFVLELRGTSLTSATVDFCVIVEGRVAYRHVWKASSWLGDSQNEPSPNGDSLIRQKAEQFFDDRAFLPNVFTGAYLSQDWDENFQNPYASAAYSLKQYAYRDSHGLPVAISLPQTLEDSVMPSIFLPASVRDSLYDAPVDSAAVRALVERMAEDRALTFGYGIGGELGIEIAWDRISRRFVLVFG